MKTSLQPSARAERSGREVVESAREIVATGRADDQYQTLIEWLDASMRWMRERSSAVTSRTGRTGVIHDG